MEGCVQLTQSDLMQAADVIFWPSLVLGGCAVLALVAVWALGWRVSR